MGKEARYETVTPTWEGLLPVMLMALRDGDTKARTAAMGELRRMARIADVAVANAKGGE